MSKHVFFAIVLTIALIASALFVDAMSAKYQSI